MKTRSVTARILWALLLIVMLVLVAAAAATAMLAPRALAVKDTIETTLPLVVELQQAILTNNDDRTAELGHAIEQAATDIDSETDGMLWRTLEHTPILGENLRAARTASTALAHLNDKVVRPASGLDGDSLRPSNAKFDLPAIRSAADTLNEMSNGIEEIERELATIDRESLIGPVDEQFETLDETVSAAHALVARTQSAFEVLPTALGADGGRTYVLITQDNAELRSSGGVIDSLTLLRMDEGSLTLGQTITATDLEEGRWGQAITGFRGVTETPDFSAVASRIADTAHDTFGVEIDGVLSVDTPMMQELARLAGPVTLTPENFEEFLGTTPGARDAPEGENDALTRLPAGGAYSENNVVEVLTTDRYFVSSDESTQEALFPFMVTAMLPLALDGRADAMTLVTTAIETAADGHLRFAFTDETEQQVLADARVAGMLPDTNHDRTTLGFVLNDRSDSKLGTYLLADVTVETAQCRADRPEFALELKLSSTLAPEGVDRLGWFVSPGLTVPRGETETEAVVFGPVGTVLRSVTLNGEPVSSEIRAGDDGRSFTGLEGRPALLIPLHHAPGTEHTIRAVFETHEINDRNVALGSGSELQRDDSSEHERVWGPLDVHHTAMVQPAEITVSAPGCE